MIDFKSSIENYLATEIKVLSSLNIDELNLAANAIADAKKRGANIYTIGNGGSSATASHMVCDLAKGLYECTGKNRMNIECLSDNIPSLMAIANDIGFEEVFRFQLKDKLQSEDLLIAISGSGNSKNIINAVEYAKELGTVVIGISGYSGGKLRELCDYSMHVNIDDMQISEDVHMIFDHMLLRILSEAGV